MNKINVYHDAWRATRTAGRWDLALHDLRPTAASPLLAPSGAELAELTFVLGHSQIAHAVDLYGHLVPGRLEGLRKTFDAAVTAAQGTAAPIQAPDRPRLRLRLVT